MEVAVPQDSRGEEEDLWTSVVPCLTGNPQTGQQRTGLLALMQSVDLRSVLYDDADRNDADDLDADGLEDLVKLLGQAVRGNGESAGGEAAKEPVLPPERGRHVALLSVPAHMIPKELLQFMAPFREDILLMRIVSHCSPALSSSHLHHDNDAPDAPAATPPPSSSSIPSLAPSVADGPRLNGVTVDHSHCEHRDRGGTTPIPAHRPHQQHTQRLPAKCMVLLEMSTQVAAETLYTSLHNRPFNSLEPTRCLVAFIRSLTFTDTDSVSPPRALAHAEAGGMTPTGDASQGGLWQGSMGGGAKRPSLVADVEARMDKELPQCVVCLEALRLSGTNDNTGGSDSVAGSSPSTTALAGVRGEVVITACNHAFHMDCLRRLDGPLCPVCRYNHDAISYISSTCSECGRTTDLWVCLICGHIGCGRYHLQHSRRHYLESLHAYAIEVQTQQVWDFAGDGYVHRLLYHKGDGSSKLVEVADPSTTSDQRPLIAPPSDDQEEEMMHRKLEDWAQQYTALLSSSLEEQRLVFEQKLTDLKAAQANTTYAMTPDKLISALKQERRQLEHRCTSARDRLKKVHDEINFLQELNQSLEKNKVQLEQQMQDAERELHHAEADRQLKLPRFEQKVRELMMRLDHADDAEGVVQGGAGGGGSSEADDRGAGEIKGVEEAKEMEGAAVTTPRGSRKKGSSRRKSVL